MRLSNTKVKTYRRCPKQFEFKYVHRLEPKRKKVQLYRGDWLHQLLMVHYDGEDWLDRQAVLTNQFNNLFEEEREELGNLPVETERIFKNYLRHWKEDDAPLRTIDSEVDEVLVLPNGDEFNFIIDLIVEETDGGIWLWDHKCVKDFLPEDFFLIDAQLARYFWAAEKMGYTPLRGVMFNELRTKPPTVPEQLKSGGLTQRQNLQTDVYTYYSELIRLGLPIEPYKPILRRLKARTGDWFRRTRLPRDRALTRTVMREMMMTSREMQAAIDLNEFPRAPDRSCSWMCDFYEPCVIQLQGGDIDDVIRLRYNTKTGPREEKK